VTQPPQGAAYFPAIETRYGRPIGHWQDALRTHRAQRPGATFMQQVSWLRTEHGFGHGHATALVAATPKD